MHIKPAHVEFAEKLTRDLMWELCQKKGFTPSDLADKVGGSPRTYDNYQYYSNPSLAGFCGLVRVGKPHEMMKKLARQCDGYFIPVPPECKGKLEELTNHTADIMRETADIMKTVANALEDKKLSKGEKVRIAEEADEAIESLIKLKLFLGEAK